MRGCPRAHHMWWARPPAHDHHPFHRHAAGPISLREFAKFGSTSGEELMREQYARNSSSAGVTTLPPRRVFLGLVRGKYSTLANF